jgi:hypothetical protein
MRFNWNAIAGNGLVYQGASLLLMITSSAAKGMLWAQETLNHLLIKQGLVLDWNASWPLPNKRKKALAWLVYLALKGNLSAQEMIIDLSNRSPHLFDWHANNEDRTRILRWGSAGRENNHLKDFDKCPTPFWGLLLGAVLEFEWAQTALLALLTQNPKNIDWRAKPLSGKYANISAFELVIELLKQRKPQYFRLFFDCLPESLDFIIQGRNIVHVLLSLGYTQEMLLFCLAYPSAMTPNLRWTSQRSILNNPELTPFRDLLAKILFAKQAAIVKYQTFLTTIRIRERIPQMQFLPAEIYKSISIKVISSMLKEVTPDTDSDLMEKALLHSTDFSPHSHADEAKSYEFVAVLGAKVLREELLWFIR